jgi:hypothetical protein
VLIVPDAKAPSQRCSKSRQALDVTPTESEESNRTAPGCGCADLVPIDAHKEGRTDPLLPSAIGHGSGDRFTTVALARHASGECFAANAPADVSQSELTPTGQNRRKQKCCDGVRALPDCRPRGDLRQAAVLSAWHRLSSSAARRFWPSDLKPLISSLKRRDVAGGRGRAVPGPWSGCLVGAAHRGQ